MSSPRRRHLADLQLRPVLAALSVALFALTACGGEEAPVQTLGWDDPLPDEVPPNTTLVVGDPQIKVALELSGAIDDFSFDIEWANFSGGPQTTEAFRAEALDVGAVAEIPAIHATWTGLPVKIVASRFGMSPLNIRSIAWVDANVSTYALVTGGIAAG